MQPEPSEVSQNLLTKEHPSQPTTASHHGFQHDSPILEAALDKDEGRGERDRRRSFDNAPASGRRSIDQDKHATDGPSYLTQSSRQRVNLISECETYASSSTTTKPDEPQVKISKQSRNVNPRLCRIVQLPNEVLTQILSHLPPADLTTISLVSRQFHSLVTAPHAWRTGFATFFPGSDALSTSKNESFAQSEDRSFRSGRRCFTRLTGIASWRSEYLLRVQLMRCLARGRPASEIAVKGVRSGAKHAISPVIMYDSRLLAPVKHLHANFDNSVGKRSLRFVHGEDEIGTASMSAPTSGRTEGWGLSDPHELSQFADDNPGDAEWGLGDGEVVGVPNVMDVSQPHGMVIGAGWHGGPLYHRLTDEMRGRYLAEPLALSEPRIGIPRLISTEQAVCSVWIAKSRSIPYLSDGIIGILSGSSLGIISSYSLGTEGLRDRRLGRGELTARWAVSPGIPIIALAVDDTCSLTRVAQNRIWAVALNALGELYYITKFPRRPHIERGVRMDQESIETTSWITGRSVYWNLVEPSRRQARPDPYKCSDVDGSYSPRSSWAGMCLSAAQLEAETKEIEMFLQNKPKYFRQACLGWDMRRKLEVDFAGDDGRYAGESALVFDCGLEEDGSPAQVQRYTRCRVLETDGTPRPTEEMFEPNDCELETGRSLFGQLEGTRNTLKESGVVSSATASSSETSSQASWEGRTVEDWRLSRLRFGSRKHLQITATAIDESTYARLTMSEDPFFSTQHSPEQNTSTASGGPATYDSTLETLPGQRARFVALGTATGSILAWDARSSIPKTANLVNDVSPIRVIHTDSPQITCLGLTALYIVSGGNDGLVQMWDPLASSNLPIRTLNSRFSSRARRRLAQSDAALHTGGINMYAAGAIMLDHDATRLRGMVSLGKHLRYWSYSSSSTDRHKSSKRQLRRSGRMSNSSYNLQHGVPTKSGNLRNYIADEWLELDRNRKTKQRETQRLAGRFGLDLLGPDASEEEMLAYAAMLSEESLAEERRRAEESSSPASSVDSADSSSMLSSSSRATPVQDDPMEPDPSLELKTDAELDADIAQAIRLSLECNENGTRPNLPMEPSSASRVTDHPIRYVQDRRSAQKQRQHSGSLSRNASGAGGGASNEASSSKVPESDADLDLDLAMQISLAEQQGVGSGLGSLESGDEYPALTSAETAIGKGKGKGKGK